MKKIISVLLAFVMLIGVTSSMGVTAFAEDETSDELSYSGKCGENVYYNFDESTATLTISGTGDMADYASSGYHPWSNYEEYISSVIIENGVTSIGDYAFRRCNLTSVMIPDGVTSIGGFAFSGCKFTSVKIPDSVISIKAHAFDNCNYLTSVMLPKNIKSLGSSISETSLGSGVFDSCYNLNDISVSSENKYYSSQEGVLFDKNKTELICYPAGKTQTKYIVPNGVTEIGLGAFEDCNLENIVLPESLKSIGIAAFQSCRITNITIPASVTSIGWSAFYWCTRLTDISVSPENNNYSSQDGVLFNKDKTNLIRYPAGKVQEKYVIPNGVKSFNNDTFNNCYSLKSIAIPDSVINGITTGSFAFCHSLTEIIVSPGNNLYSSQDGVLFDKNKTALICYPANKTETEYTVPNGVKEICWGAFENCKNLVDVTISDSVTSIEGYAFVNSSLKNIKMFNSVISIGAHAFANCGVENVIMSNNITSLGEGAFYKSGYLKSVTIPNNITIIEENTFDECKSLTSITIPNTVKSVGNYAFDKCLNLSDVYYTGTEEQWKKIQIGSNNECLTNASIHFQSQDPTTATGGSSGSGTSGSGSSDGGSSSGSSGSGTSGSGSSDGGSSSGSSGSGTSGSGSSDGGSSSGSSGSGTSGSGSSDGGSSSGSSGSGTSGSGSSDGGSSSGSSGSGTSGSGSSDGGSSSGSSGSGTSGSGSSDGGSSSGSSGSGTSGSGSSDGGSSSGSSGSGTSGSGSSDGGSSSGSSGSGTSGSGSSDGGSSSGSSGSGTSGSGSSNGGSSSGSSDSGTAGAAPTIPEEKPTENPGTKPITPPSTLYSKPKQVCVNKPQAKEKALVVTWKKANNVSGYEVQLATDKNFKKNKKKINIKKHQMQAKRL